MLGALLPGTPRNLHTDHLTDVQVTEMTDL